MQIQVTPGRKRHMPNPHRGSLSGSYLFVVVLNKESFLVLSKQDHTILFKDLFYFTAASISQRTVFNNDVCLDMTDASSSFKAKPK